MTANELQQLNVVLREANQAAQIYADTEDGGTCNFDSLAIKVKTTEPQMKQLEFGSYKWGKRDSDGKTWWVISLDYSGQGNRRTRMAEEAARYMSSKGYNATVYYEID